MLIARNKNRFQKYWKGNGIMEDNSDPRHGRSAFCSFRKGAAPLASFPKLKATAAR